MSSALFVIATTIIAIGMAPRALAAQRGPAAPKPVPPVGCWKFDTPLGPSAAGTADEERDQRWYVVGLRKDGSVSRPLMRTDSAGKYEAGSRWTVDRDTITVMLTDGTSGWQARVLHHASALVGEVKHVTGRTVASDAASRPARATMEPCKAATDTVRAPG